MREFDLFAAAAIKGITSVDFDGDYDPAYIAQRATEIALEMLRSKHANQEKIAQAMLGITPFEHPLTEKPDIPVV